MRSGYFRRITPAGGWKSELSGFSGLEENIPFTIPTAYPDGWEEADRQIILDTAQSICAGYYFPFSSEKAPLKFAVPQNPMLHWTRCKTTIAGRDIKFIWEPARFSWAFPLIQAYTMTQDDRYAECFWSGFDRFIQLNPVNMGPAWSSAQEVALRMIPWLWALKSFSGSTHTTLERTVQLYETLENSARRILPTLSYARSQNNNHLLSEALGLIIIGRTLLGVHPSAQKWMQIGFTEFEYGILTQIDEIGNYCQQSANYHRLMLHLALLYNVYAHSVEHKIPSEIIDRLALSTQYLFSWLDQSSGSLPNYGHNDGAFLLPFGAANYRDYRPTLQAASLAFLGCPAFPPGKWDALPQWLGISQAQHTHQHMISPLPSVLRVGDEEHWASLRAVQYQSRPAHADQLTIDLWWNGVNIAQDAGTYLYNAPDPWENSLTGTDVHNTIQVDNKDQMLHAGKFLMLDRLDAKSAPATRSKNRVAAEIIPNKRIPCRHKRTLEWNPPHNFYVLDELIPPAGKTRSHTYTLQWLVPDWEWNFLPTGIQLQHEEILLQLRISCQDAFGLTLQPEFSLIRAGETLFGSRKDPIRGWVSPTYAIKCPALSISFSVSSPLPVTLTSIWDFSHSSIKTG